uniref:Lysine ketoglutarate reductase trans-splicing-like protein n=1 Tax=Ananas comosus var. bracteatus TaxID=296719 RepID=A0A6V7NRS8_ANACO|nr:unnamed protein product [Ananas comosus var. bracteatus]
MKQTTSFGFFALLMALALLITMKIQTKHLEMDLTRNPSLPTEREWRGELQGLPRGIIEPTTDMELKSMLKNSRLKDASDKSNSLLAMAVGISQKKNVDNIVRKFLIEDFSIMLFHYDGSVDGWHDLNWSNKAVHILAYNQTKWWFAKRFLHPDVVSIYDYIFLWDEDLGVENFHPRRYLKIMFSEGLEISQPALDPDQSSDIHHRITIRNKMMKVHRRIYDFRGSLNCSDESKGPPCTGWVEGMAPVFSRAAWRCVWHLIQNDLIHGWGLDMKLGYCAQGDQTKKVGVIDSEFIVHQGIPSLGGPSVTKALHRSVDLRSQIRRQSTAELEKFKERWNKAVKEDKEWTDRFVKLARKKNGT